MADPIQITYDSAGIQAKLDAAGTAVQGSALKGLAATLTAGDATSLTTSDRLDNLVNVGNYKIGTSSVASDVVAPLNAAGRVLVWYTSASNRLVQIYIGNYSAYPRVFIRGSFASGWTQWVELISTGTSAYQEIASALAEDGGTWGT